MAFSKLCASQVCGKVWYTVSDMWYVYGIIMFYSVLSDMPRLAQLLQSLTSVDRFSTVVLFLSKQEKEGRSLVLLCVGCTLL